MRDQPALLEPSEWTYLYHAALQESRPGFVFTAIHNATKAMALRLSELDPKETAKRNILLAALDDLRVFQIIWTGAANGHGQE